MFVLDTHTLLWWILAPKRLSSRAEKICARIDEEGGGVVSAISIWEIGRMIRNDTLVLGMPFKKYVSLLEKSDALEIVAVDADTWQQSLNLVWSNEDIADRVIVSLATLEDLPIITPDPSLRRYYSRIIW